MRKVCFLCTAYVALGPSSSAPYQQSANPNYEAIHCARTNELISRSLGRGVRPSMDYANALVGESSEYPPRWNFSNWTSRTALACTRGETSAICQYGIEPHRRAGAMVPKARDECDPTRVRRTQVEARTDKEGAQTKKRSALRSTPSSLFELASSKKSTVESNQTSSKRNQLLNMTNRTIRTRY